METLNEMLESNEKLKQSLKSKQMIPKYQQGKPIYYVSDGTFVNDKNESLQVLNRLGTNPSQWTFTDDKGNIYTPHRQQKNNGQIKQGEKVHPAVNTINQYFRQAKYELNPENGQPLSGKYAIPGILLGGVTPTMFSIPGAATMAGGYLGSKAVDFGTKLVTGKSWADKMHDWTGLDREPAEMTNPGMWAGGYGIPKYGTNVMRRGVETAMRTSPMQNGLTTVWDNTKKLMTSKDYQRIGAIGKYILTGKSTGNKGYYNSLRFDSPEENYYGGFDWIPENLRGKNDIIDAFLYKKKVDPGFGLYRKAIGKNFGEHSDYVAKNYSGKAKDIQVYSTSKTEPSSNKIKVNGSKGVDSEIETTENVGFDAAGHRQIYGTDVSGNQYTMEQDIWKFKPKEYIKKWLDNNKDVYLPLWKKALMKTGLKATDYVGTPVIVRTPWQKVNFNTPKKATLHGDLSAPPSEIYIDMNDLLKNVKLSNLTQPK